MVKNVLSKFVGKKNKDNVSKVDNGVDSNKHEQRDYKLHHKKYRMTKIIKHKTKTFNNNLLQKICARQIGLIELLINLGIYKKTLMLKLAFVIVPFLILLVIDDIVTALIVSIVDIFFCAFIFSITSTSRSDGIVNGIFDYARYRYIRAYRETVAILMMFFILLVLIICGHYFLKSLVPAVVEMVVE